jgi:hypothetical protein
MLDMPSESGIMALPEKTHIREHASGSNLFVGGYVSAERAVLFYLKMAKPIREV